MCNLISNPGSANQSHISLDSIHIMWHSIDRINLTRPSIRDDVDQHKLSYISGGNASWYKSFGKQFVIIF